MTLRYTSLTPMLRSPSTNLSDLNEINLNINKGAISALYSSSVPGAPDSFAQDFGTSSIRTSAIVQTWYLSS